MKTSRLVLFSFIFSTILCSPLVAQEKVYWDIAARIREEGFERSMVMDYAWYLSEVFGPRLTGSPNMKSAQKWVKDKMDEIGLAKTSIEPWGDKFASWDIEHISIHMTEPDYQMIIGYPLALTPGTDGELVSEAMIVSIEKPEDLEKYKGTLQNRMILVDPKRAFSPRFAPDAVRHDLKSLSAYETTGIDINMNERRQETWNKGNPSPEGLSESALEKFYKSEGVAVVLKAGKGGDGTVGVTGRPTSRNDRSLAGIMNSVPMLSLAPEHYNRIYRLVENNIPVKMEVDIRIKVSEETEGYNVLGEMPGTDLADEVVMIGAHLDSWHSATGATDNASGVSTVLEAMRILQAIGVQPRRTIRAGFWGAEEGGLKGSRGYVKNHLGNPRDGIKSGYDGFSVYFNMDNGTGRFRGVHLQGNKLVAAIFESWMKPFRDLGMGTLSQYSNRGTDHLAFDEAGLPGFQFLQDRIDYRSRTWHFNMDHYDHLVPEDLKANSIIMASFAYHAAKREGKIPRKKFTAWNPDFELTQEDTFGEGGTLTNAIADYDNDGDLDIFVGFRGKPNRLYRNDGKQYTDVGAKVGLAESGTTRTSAWGDYNGDGHLDLFVAFVDRGKSWCRLYRNDGDGKSFTDVATDTGLDITGSFRQANWVDYDHDGDVDLYIGLRDKPNAFFQNNGGKLTNIAERLGVNDPRRTVGVVWFDYDKDGDLDLYVTNMDGDANGLYRNDGSRFLDVAEQHGVESGGRPLGKTTYGSVRPCLADYDNDGNIDIFVANYGPNALYRNHGDGKFVNEAPRLGLAINSCYDTGTWGDYDNNGLVDLYVNGTITRGNSYRDYLFHNDGEQFSEVTPKIMIDQNSDHGAHWADLDSDGDLDLALTGAAPEGMHHLLRNLQPAEVAGRSLQILVLDERGHYTRAGTEIRLYQSDNGKLLGTGLVDTGSGYNSQNAMPVHFGLAHEKPVDIEITTLTGKERKTDRLSNIDPQEVGRSLTIRVDKAGRIVK